MNFQFIVFITAATYVLTSSLPDHHYAEEVAKSEINAYLLNQLKDYYNEHKGENVISALNTYLMLGAAYLGSDGITRKELAAVMGSPQDDKRAALIMEGLRRIYKKIPATEITVANAIFMQQNNTIKEQYINMIKDYGFDVFYLDFKKNAQRASDLMNEWAFKKTGISLPHSEPVDPLLTFGIESLLTIHAQWLHPFRAENTKREDFYDELSNKHSVVLMREQRDVQYYYSPADIAAISLQCEGPAGIEMVFLLPKINFGTMMNHLTIKEVNDILKSMQTRKVDFKVPYMKIKFEYSPRIKNSLNELGVEKFFNKPNLNNMLSVRKSIQAANMQFTAAFEVVENGIMANASGSTIINLLDSFDTVPTPENVTQFYINRPYITLLYSRSLDIILFAAVVYNPSEMH